MAKKNQKTEELESASAIAERLSIVRAEKNALSTVEKKLSTELKARIKGGEEQSLFKIEQAYSLGVSDMSKAMPWVQGHYPHLVSIDTSKLHQVLRRSLEPLPEGFAVKTTERLVEIGGSSDEE